MLGLLLIACWSAAGSAAPPPPPLLPPSASSTCADDPLYHFDDGVAPDGSPVTWTCTNWTNVICRAGGWGVRAGPPIDELVKACPAACADGACHGVHIYDDPNPVVGAPFRLVKKVVHCASEADLLKRFSPPTDSSLSECADLCAAKWGCRFFTFGGTSGAAAGECWQEGFVPQSASVKRGRECREGWLYTASVNFYELSGPSPPPLPMMPPQAPPPPPPGVLLRAHELFLVSAGPIIAVSAAALAVLVAVRVLMKRKRAALERLWQRHTRSGRLYSSHDAPPSDAAASSTVPAHSDAAPGLDEATCSTTMLSVGTRNNRDSRCDEELEEPAAQV